MKGNYIKKRILAYTACLLGCSLIVGGPAYKSREIVKEPEDPYSNITMHEDAKAIRLRRAMGIDFDGDNIVDKVYKHPTLFSGTKTYIMDKDDFPKRIERIADKMNTALSEYSE